MLPGTKEENEHWDYTFDYGNGRKVFVTHHRFIERDNKNFLSSTVFLPLDIPEYYVPTFNRVIHISVDGIEKPLEIFWGPPRNNNFEFVGINKFSVSDLYVRVYSEQDLFAKMSQVNSKIYNELREIFLQIGIEDVLPLTGKLIGHYSSVYFSSSIVNVNANKTNYLVTKYYIPVRQGEETFLPVQGFITLHNKLCDSSREYEIFRLPDGHSYWMYVFSEELPSVVDIQNIVDSCKKRMEDFFTEAKVQYDIAMGKYAKEIYEDHSEGVTYNNKRIIQSFKIDISYAELSDAFIGGAHEVIIPAVLARKDSVSSYLRKHNWEIDDLPTELGNTKDFESFYYFISMDEKYREPEKVKDIVDKELEGLINVCKEAVDKEEEIGR